MSPTLSPRSTIETRVRYGETDQMGVVYHAVYLVWCDMGRTEYIREMGVSYAELEQEGLLLVVTDASLRYHAPARYDELVRIETWLERVQSRILTFGYEISRRASRPERLVTAATRLIALDRQGNRRSLPAGLVESFRQRKAGG